jgi:putative ABC transport system permease protein
VTGVLPQSFRFLLPTPQRPDVHPKEIDAYEPDVMTPQSQVRGGANAIVNVVARLKPGVPLEHARTELEGIQARIARQNRNISYGGVTLRVLPLREKLVGNSRRALLILFGAAVFVLLIACANVASLLLSRANARRREIAIRAAVGAGQARVIAQLLVEGMLL